MCKMNKYLIPTTVVLLLSACSSYNEDNPLVPTESERSVLIYMAAENNLSSFAESGHLHPKTGQTFPGSEYSAPDLSDNFPRSEQFALDSRHISPGAEYLHPELGHVFPTSEFLAPDLRLIFNRSE
jgi:hypothetical protein